MKWDYQFDTSRKGMWNYKFKIEGVLNADNIKANPVESRTSNSKI